MTTSIATPMAVPANAPVKLPGSLDTNRRLSSWIRIAPDGSVRIMPGKVEIGQGIVTALSQIAPRALIRVFTSDASALDVGEEYLRIVSINFIASGMTFVTASMSLI